LSLTFSVYDLNKDGFIQREELEIILHLVTLVNNDKKMTPEEEDRFITNFVNDTFEKYNVKKDNQLSFEEFVDAAKSNDQVAEFFTLSGNIIAKQH